MADPKHIAAKAPARAKILAELSHVSAEDRARAGVTDEMVKAQAEKQKPPSGIHVVEGPWLNDEDADLDTQIRVIDYDKNKVLFSGTPTEYARLVAVMKKEG